MFRLTDRPAYLFNVRTLEKLRGDPKVEIKKKKRNREGETVENKRGESENRAEEGGQRGGSRFRV